MIVYEASLLVETGRYLDFEGLIVVEAEAPIRTQRLQNRDHLTPELAQKIMDAQASDREKIAQATQVFKNSGTLEELRSQVQAFAKAQRWIS